MFDKMMSKAGGDFLGSILGPIGSGFGQQIAQGLFGRKNRLSNRDFEHYQNLLDKGNPREIERQKQFLEGLTPSQAAAHNVFQDATYGEDTRRFMERQQQLVPQQAQLDKEYMDTVYEGTSAWERLGSSAAPSLQAPAPSPTPQRGQADQAFLGALTPLVTAEMQQQTALAQSAIQSWTSLKQTDMQTAGGRVAEMDVVLKDAQELLTNQQAEKAYMEAIRTKQQVGIDMASAIFSLAEEVELDFGVFRTKGKRISPELVAYLENPNLSKDEAGLLKFMEDNPQTIDTLGGESLQVAAMLMDLTKRGTRAAADSADDLANFLSRLGIGKGVQTETVTTKSDNDGRQSFLKSLSRKR